VKSGLLKRSKVYLTSLFVEARLEEIENKKTPLLQHVFGLVAGDDL
jgi:hypothetical protein